MSWEFHHLGVACADLDREADVFTRLGYVREGAPFEDERQGIRGQFMTGPGPRVELLQDLPGSRTVAGFVERGVRYYHQGFYVDDFDAEVEALKARRAKALGPAQPSAYFGARIVFLALSPHIIVELIERQSSASAS